MSRGRFLSRTISTNQKLGDLSLSAYAAYISAIPHLDRDGLIDGRPVILWAQIAPLRAELMDAMPAIIQEWIGAGLVVRYNGDREPVLFFPAFQRHNAGLRYDRETESRYPPPPGYGRHLRAGLLPLEELSEYQSEPDQGAAAALRQDSGVTPDKLRSYSGANPRQEEGGSDVVFSEEVFSEEVFSEEVRTDQDRSASRGGRGGGAAILSHSRAGGECERGAADFAPGADFAPADDDAQGEGLAELDDAALRLLCFRMGRPLRLHKDWTDYRGALQRYTASELRALARWLYHLVEMAEGREQGRELTNFAGFLIRQLRNGNEPMMSDSDEWYLDQRVAQVLGDDSGLHPYSHSWGRP